MAAVDLRKVRQVLRTRLFTAPGIPASSFFAAENRKFSPPDPPATWIRESLLPGSELQVAFGIDEALGRTQYDVCVPQGAGTEAADDLATAIATVFQPTLSLLGQGITVQVYRTERGRNAQLDDAWWILPVVLSWRTHAFH